MSKDGFPNYVKLFGDIDFREADEARSVYSPAAYLADLLQLIDDQFVSSSDLDQRRSDLKQILLDSENTFTLLPYLDIVNEVLEKKVEGASDQDAYDTLKQVHYPINLPFNLHHDRIVLYEKYFGITPEQFHKVFASSYDNDIVAREFLGLSKEAATVITEPAEDALALRYGDRLSDIGSRTSVPIDEFIDVTGLTYVELRELLVGNLGVNELKGGRQLDFFCNSHAEGFAKYDSTEENIVWSNSTAIPKQWFDCVQRIIRLSRITGLSILELDLIIRDCCNNSLDMESLKRIAIVKYLGTTLSLKIDETCALFSTISDMGHGDEDLPIDLFSRVFNGGFASVAKSYVGTYAYMPAKFEKDEFKRLDYTGDILALDNKTYRNRIAQGLKISEKQLQVAIRGFRSRDNEDIDDEDNHDRLWSSQDEEMSMLSVLYRSSKLVEVLDISFEDLFMLLDILERDPAVRQFANSGVFIDYDGVTERNCYAILRQEWVIALFSIINTLSATDSLSRAELVAISEKLVAISEKLLAIANSLSPAGSLSTVELSTISEQLLAISDSLSPTDSLAAVELSTISERLLAIAKSLSSAELLWLVQLLYSLTKWLLDNDLAVEGLLQISTGRHRRNLKQVSDPDDKKNKSAEAVATEEKISLLNDLYGQLKPWLLAEESFVTNTFDQRLARIIHHVITQSALVANADTRLVHFHEKALREAAYEAISRIDLVIKADFLGLGLEEKVADKIFANLVLMGYLTTEGMLNGAMMPQASTDFSIETDFTYLQEALFKIVQELHEGFVDVSIFPSDLESLELSKPHLEELYDNLIFNGFLSEDGTLLQSSTVSSIDNLDLFEVNADIGDYADEIYALLQEKIEEFKQTKIVIGKDIFSDLSLTEIEIEDLVENLRFNEYISEDNALVDNTALLQAKAEDLLLELRFYPHRHQILAALQSHVERYRNQFYTFNNNLFFDIADQLVADWVFEAISSEYLQDGRIPEEKQDYFTDLENASMLDIAWPFEPTHNRVVFERIRAIILSADHYRLTNEPFEAFRFDQAEIGELINVLISTGYLTIYRKIPVDKIQYFLNINNALEFTVEAFEDYGKDVFFILHEIAKRVEAAAEEITTLHRGQAAGQEDVLYQSLEEAFGLEASSIAAISKQVFVGSTNVRDEWLLPILATVNVQDKIDQEPVSSRFNTAYRRIQEFALLAAQLKLNQDEINIAFQDQNLVEKYPESIELPEMTKADGSKAQITSFDAFLESSDGRIYVFKGADSPDYARYWSYSSTTHALIETEDDKLSTLLTGDKNSSINISWVDAAFVDKHGNDVIIADGNYYVKEKAKDSAVWQIHERKWGHVDSDFENLQVVDAAFTDEAGRTYLFSNDQYVRYSNGVKDGDEIKSVDDGYPKSIADSWADEGHNQDFPKAFQASLDAAFHGTDNKTYVFKDNQFVSADKPDMVRTTNEVWGRIKNNLKTLQRVDAIYGDGPQYFVFSGDQVFAYRDCLENEGVMIQEGFPKPLVNHFGAGLPGEFHMGVDAAFKGEDGHIYLFKGDKSVAIQTPIPNDISTTTIETKKRWGDIENVIESEGNVDAALAGLDGRVYLFSGAQYFRYSSSDYSEVDSGYPRNVSKDWGGLIGINAAFVRDGKTYLFGTGEVEHADGRKEIQKAYVRYSTNDYEEPDDGYPKVQVETDDYWWNLPESIKSTQTFEEVDAIFNAPDGKTFLFSKNEFIYFDRAQNWWSEPKVLADIWPDMSFMSIDAAFTGKDGKTYFFSGTEYVRFSGDDYCQLDNGYPRPTNRLWGHVKNSIIEYGKVNAALVVESREEKEQDDGKFETVKTMHTYLFAGNQFFRYNGYQDYDLSLITHNLSDELPTLGKNLVIVAKTDSNAYHARIFDATGNIIIGEGRDGADLSDTTLIQEIKEAFENQPIDNQTKGDLVQKILSSLGHSYYGSVEPGYPKAISLLKEEPRFKNIDLTFNDGVDAAFSDRRNIYLLKGSTIHVVSDEPCATYLGSENNAFAGVVCAFMGHGGVYVTNHEGWHHISSLEGRDSNLVDQDVTLTPEFPPLLTTLTDLPDGYKTKPDAVLRGTDSNTYLFKDNMFFNVGLNRAFPISEQWGQVRNNIQDQNAIDAGFIGRDGKTYLFSGDQYVIYEGASYIGQAVFKDAVDTHAVKSIADNWGGLTNVHIAYVLQDHTYLFEKPDHAGNFRYVRYSSTDYEQPDSGFPQAVDTEFWQLPSEYEALGWDTFDAVVIENDDSMLFIKGREFLQFSATSRHWSHPQSLDVLWPGTYQDHRLFENLQSVFVSADGTAYFFGDECYIQRPTVGEITERKPIGDDWGILPSQFKDKIDAAFVYSGTTTYLFSGDQYVRYSGQDYCNIDDGYPKLITQDLRQELGFENLPSEFEIRAGELNSGTDTVILNAVVANDRNIYLFMGGNCYVSSDDETSRGSIDILGNQRNQIVETGEIDGAFVNNGKTYLFSGDQYVRYSESTYDYVDDGYPKRIVTGLAADIAAGSATKIPPKLYAGIDAALSDTGGTVYLFSDDRFFDFQNSETQAITGAWGTTKNNFAPITSDASVDGAFVDSMGKLYVFEGDQVIRYADTDQVYVETGYPKSIAATFQVPDAFLSEIDGAFTFEGRTYLVKGDEYVRYSDGDFDCLPSFYPVKFLDRWGDWSDYRLEDIKLIARFKSLQNRYAGDYTLVDLLRINQGYVKDPYALLADIFNWDVEEVKWLKRNNAFLPSATEYEIQFEMQFNLELICRMFDILSLTDKMAVGAQSAYDDIWLKRYGTAPNLAKAADELLELLGVKNGNSPDWQILVDEVHNKLNVLKRNALVPYSIFMDDKIEDVRDLYEHLLIDIQMGEVAQTSYIKEAISAIQLYLHRYFISLENADLKGTNDVIQKEALQERWKWMRNYRVWEANRKVFLYPENYIRPELRDTKTPEFKTLEEELLQGDLSEANITRAFNHYIDHYIEVSRLAIAGGYVYDSIQVENNKEIVLFGRTKSEPHQYYYRTATFMSGQSNAVDWQPWMEVNVQIDADRVYPIYALSKVFVFWAKVEVRSSIDTDTKLKFKEKDGTYKSETDAVNGSALQVYYSYFNLNGEWAPPQKIQHDITSNDKITEFYLDFSGVKENAYEDLDNIQISCHYTTERQLKPEVNQFGFVGLDEFESHFTEKQIDLDAKKDDPPMSVNVEVYIKASNARSASYIDAWSSDPSVDLDQASVKLIPSSDVLGEGSKFKIVAAKDIVAPRISPFLELLHSFGIAIVFFESVAKPNHYLQPDANGLVQLSHLNTITDQSSFVLAKGSVGDGYVFRPVFGQDARSLFSDVLYYQENADYEMIVKTGLWNALENSIAQRQMTFSFIVRKEEENTFRFYPEIPRAEKILQEIPPASNFGINTFKTLFPQEDFTQIRHPVPLSVPVDQYSLPWVCFDYKGGSFLCKPTSGQTALGEEGDLNELVGLEELPNNFTVPISAALYANDNSFLFSENGQYIIEGESTATPIKDVWGIVDNKIQLHGEIDAAFVRGGKTFLFREDQYVVYSHNTEVEYNEYVDESYPKRLAGNPDNMPDIETLGWARIDAAFQVGEISYFVSGGEYVTSGNLTTKQEIPTSTQASEVRNVFTHDGRTYSFDNNSNLSIELTQQGLRGRLDVLYEPATASDIPLANVIAAFSLDEAYDLSDVDDAAFGTDAYKTVYMKAEAEDGAVNYIKYETGEKAIGFLNTEFDWQMKGVFVAGDHFYVLIDPSGAKPYIRRWKKGSSVDTFDNFEITGAPGKDVFTCFYDGEDTHFFSNTEDDSPTENQHMMISGLPDGEIVWDETGTVIEYTRSRDLISVGLDTVDAGFNQDNYIFLISGNRYLRFTLSETLDANSETFLSAPSFPDEGYPERLGNVSTDRLPQWEHIDAAFYGPDSIVRFFNGTDYSDSEALSNIRLVKDDWGKVRNNIQEGEPGRIDAAFTIDDYTYLVSGDQYYRYATSNLNPPFNDPPLLDEEYPRRLATNLDGLPSWMIQVFELDGKVFVLDGKIYGVIQRYWAHWGIYYEFDLTTGKNTRGWVHNKWYWPSEYRDFDAAYSQDDYLYLIVKNRYLKYQDPTYDIIRLSSMTGSQLSQALFSGGIDGLMKRANQEINELPTFTFDQSQVGDAIIRVNPQRASHENFPVNSHLEFQGANGLYYWELFYHAPSLIAQTLNTAQKFEEAKQWFEYMFDPAEDHNYWKFLPFQAVDIDALIAVIAFWTEGKGTKKLKEAALKLSNKLNSFAPALLGQESMGKKKAEFEKLYAWDEALGIYKTWPQVQKFEDALPKSDDKATQEKVAATKEVIALIKRLPIRYALMTNSGPEQIKAYLDDPFDPHAIAALRRIAYRRATVMAYVDNILDWGDMRFRQYTMESINEARMLYMLAYDLLGKKPNSLGNKVLSETVSYEVLQDKGADTAKNTYNAYDFLFDVSADQTKEKSLTHAAVVHESVGNPYFYAPENDQILGYWERVEDRLYKIRHSLNIMGVKQPLPLFQPPIDPMALVRAVAGGGGLGAALAGLQVAVPHYRFTFMLNKARELAGKLNQFGNELLNTLEKKDAEALSLLQNRQEGIILKMTQAIREAQLHEAQENLTYLESSKVRAEMQRDHYADLISTGMIEEEAYQIDMMTHASNVFFAVPLLKIAAAFVSALADVKAGVGPGATTGGSTLGAALGFIAESGEPIAEGLSMRGEAAGVKAQYLRSLEDWVLQEKIAASEIEQLEAQIEGAKWQIRAAEQEVAVVEKETDHNQSINTFMTDKFSNQQLYQWMSSKLSALYFQTYKLAHDMAKSAEMAYRFERGLPEDQVNFISGNYWDSLRKGLLAGDSLEHDLDRMEKAYLDTNVRGFEITKTISLVELDPIAFLDLKTKGVCEFHLTEELFDYDFPGHYRRQVTTIAVKLNAGEGKTVNATLTQLSNKTVMEPDPKAVKYLIDPKDSQPLTIRNDWRPNQQIAVSEVDQYAGNSNGLFELYFGDDRYLPFEGTGAVSSWRLELSGKRGSYNINELADAEIELKYTARQGGQAFADSVKGMLKPYEAAVYIDMAETFPNEFFAFVYDETDDLEINITRDLFPNMAGSKITGVYSFFEMQDDGQISMVMNDDSELTLRSGKLLLTSSLAVSARGETWTFKARGPKSDLVNMGLVFGYKARVA